MKLRHYVAAIVRAQHALAFVVLASFAGGSAHAQGLVWAKRAGGNGYTLGQGVAVDSAGATYVTGYFTDSSTFGPGQISQTTLQATPQLTGDIFVAKYDSAGTLVWAKRAGGTAGDFGYGIAVDSTGNSYVVGSFAGSATFGDGESGETTLTSAGGGVDIFVAKFDSAGALVWAKRAGSSGVGSGDEGRSVAIDGSGNVVVAGYFAGAATFGPAEVGATVLTSAGQHDIFIAKFSGATGELIWARRAGGIEEDQGIGVGVDGAGNGYLTGYFRSSATFGPSQPNSTLLSTGGQDDIFVAKYDSDGVLAWARRAGGASTDSGYGIAVDAAGNSYLTGSFSGSATFGPGTPSAVVVTASGASLDIFIAKYDTSGTLSWAKRAGGVEADYGFAVAVDSVGNSYVTGQFRGSSGFGAGGGATTLISAGTEDVFVAKYDTAGILGWAKRAGGSTVDYGRGIALQGSPSNIHVAGAFQGSAIFGAGEVNQTTLNGTGFYDFFAAKFLESSATSSALTRVGVYNAGSWRLDSNGNGAPDDTLFAFNAGPSATRLVGDWNGDGDDEIGLFINGFWFLDHNENGFYDGPGLDRQYAFGWNGVTPLVGDWNGDGKDEIGIFINGFWFLDADGDGQWDGPLVDISAEFGWNGVTPFVGDWNGDGRDKIGIFINGFWYKDYNGNSLWDGPVTDRQAEFGWSAVTPFVGDWNGDGRDKIGIFINGFWFLDMNGNDAWDGPGTDRQAQFGWNGVTPILGDWNGSAFDKIGIFINGIFYLDFDGSGTWDGGAADKGYGYGQAGDTPAHGRW